MTDAQNLLAVALPHGGLWRGKTYYIRSDSWDAAVHAFEREGLAVLGIELFESSESRIRPRLDLIADFDCQGLPWSSLQPRTIGAARQFLRGVDVADTDLFASFSAVTRAVYEQLPA